MRLSSVRFQLSSGVSFSTCVTRPPLSSVNSVTEFEQPHIASNAAQDKRRRVCVARIGPNENKMSDGGRERALLGLAVWKSSQKWRVQRSAVRSIAWLDVRVIISPKRFTVCFGRGG